MAKEAAISPLRRRMIEDATIRKFARKTQEGYIRTFSALFRAPRQISELRGFASISTASARERLPRGVMASGAHGWLVLLLN
jgi:hypothetical protein